MKLLEHGMNVVEKVLEKRFHIIVSVDEMQFGFLPDRGTIDEASCLWYECGGKGVREKDSYNSVC